ncbi:MAG: TonB-dependent receptor, partial [Deinococcales bacterium]|nr:TonB-dependent receptor [Chitinophagaceae bacterium]
FDLDLVFQAVSGNTVYFGSNQFRPFQGFGQVGVSAVDRWTPATSTTALFPRLSSTDNLNNYRFSSLWQRDGSFVKLRSAEIGYSLPAKLIAKVKLEQARFFVNGNNLFCIDHISYGDPESLGTGYPSLRTITFGARIQF